jgi:hypothetical protein
LQFIVLILQFILVYTWMRDKKSFLLLILFALSCCASSEITAGADVSVVYSSAGASVSSIAPPSFASPSCDVAVVGFAK